MLNRLIRYFLYNPLIAILFLILMLAWGLVTAPFGWNITVLPSDPVPVDAIPDIGENQQIVFTEWKGQSPQDIEDQITYPLTTYLLGIPGVKSIRSSSIFGFSSIYIIFSDDIEFYWSRSRILEKLNSLPAGLLPAEAQPSLGPDATALGQIFWYTLEGRDSNGNPTGGWDLQEIRTVQDFYVKYALNTAEGVSEVASIGGFVQEYQVDVDPAALNAYGIPITDVIRAVRRSNRDSGARTLEINKAEYLLRGLGNLSSTEDLEKAVVAFENNVPITIKDIGSVRLGPATRRGLLDKDGAEVVGGVVVARHGANPLEVIQNVKAKIQEISTGLPGKTLSDGTESRLTIVPFYDRSELIYETLGTLEEALALEILVTILVVIVMVRNLRASLLISSLLPISVLMVFIAMRYFHVDANIVALSGIAIAIGTMVDLGIILTENVIKHMEKAGPHQKLIDVVYEGSAEVASAIFTAVSTTIVSFIPVFTLQAAEGKLFGPLAYTKTFALIAALLVTLLLLPTLAYGFFKFNIARETLRQILRFTLALGGVLALFFGFEIAGFILISIGLMELLKKLIAGRNLNLPLVLERILKHSDVLIALTGTGLLLAKYWLPLGASKSLGWNFLMVILLVGLILGAFNLLERHYKSILHWCLRHKIRFLLLPALMILLGLNIWLGFHRVFGFVESGLGTVGISVENTSVWRGFSDLFPGIGKEFMPSLDEGSFLLMPTSMPHSGVEYNRDIVARLDMIVSSIPEVEIALGKMGRVESALDPAPISMFENIINYKPEYLLDEKGRRQRFSVDEKGHFETRQGIFVSNEQALNLKLEANDLIPDPRGRYFRNWRDHISSPDDIWNEIVEKTRIPGVTSAPKLQPIETRLVMLQTGMRAPMGIKVFGPDLQVIESFGQNLEAILSKVPSVKSEAVFSERIVGKPYIHLNIDRDKISFYGLAIDDVQNVIETAIGGMTITHVLDGRQRFPVRVRYPRELRDSPEALSRVLVPTPSGAQIPLSQVADIQYEQGPQSIKSENTFLVGYVLFDKRDGFSEVTVVEDARKAIQNHIHGGQLTVPAGVSFEFSGTYENQVRAEKRLSIVVPLVLVTVFLILYFQFRSVSTSLMVFSGITLAFSGGFIMLWLYGQPWFADFSLLGTDFRDLFQIKTVNLSVAVWVGFIALFGIATDDGVLIATYLDQSFKRNSPKSIRGVREAVVEAGMQRVRPALMTVSTTMIALLPVLTSTGRGSDIMVPMAIPIFGGMTFAIISIFIVPVIYSYREERRISNNDL